MVQSGPILMGFCPCEGDYGMGGRVGHVSPEERDLRGGKNEGGFGEEIGNEQKSKVGHEKERDQESRERVGSGEVNYRQKILEGQDSFWSGGNCDSPLNCPE